MNMVLIYFLCLRVQYLPAVCYCIWALETCVNILAFCVKLRLCFSMESKKWWHTKTLMSANHWCTPRRASTCCSSTSPGITRWSFLRDGKRELFRYEVNNVDSTCWLTCVWRSGLSKRELLIDPMKTICCFFCSVFIGTVISIFRRLFFSLNSQL